MNILTPKTESLLRRLTARPACLLTIVLIATAFQAHGQTPTHFDVNDIAFLWPVPKTSADVAQLISVDEKLADGTSSIIPDDIFRQLISTAQTVSVTANGSSPVSILLPAGSPLTDAHNWKVVGIRVDPCAPGTDKAITDIAGIHPQIRIILQPVTVNPDGRVQVRDLSAHLVFDFTSITADGKIGPDKIQFGAILDQLKDVKALVQAANVDTSGPLRVHPGFQAVGPALTSKLRALLTANVSRAKLIGVAMMGIRTPEPWIFFALGKQKDGTFAAVPAEMFAFSGLHVAPKPITGNFGNVSTSIVFNSTGTGGFDLNPTQLATPISPQAVAPDGQAVKLRDVPEIIANPSTANFFNTDCVSCHTESSRRISPGMQPANGSLSYQRPAGVSGVDPTMLPQAGQGNWNLRNFGWFPNFFRGTTDPTITQRTANETAASADYINREYFNQQPTVPAAPVVQAPAASPALPPIAIGPVIDLNASHGLTLIMKINGVDHLQALAALLDPNLPADQAVSKITQDRITTAMNKIGTVHFARFVVRPEQMELMVITDFDGDFAVYIDAFTDAIGGIFDQLLEHTTDGANLVPVSTHQEAFLKYVQDHDASFDKETNSSRSSYSAYPNLKVQDILNLEKQASDAAAATSKPQEPAK